MYTFNGDQDELSWAKWWLAHSHTQFSAAPLLCYQVSIILGAFHFFFLFIVFIPTPSHWLIVNEINSNPLWTLMVFSGFMSEVGLREHSSDKQIKQISTPNKVHTYYNYFLWKHLSSDPRFYMCVQQVCVKQWKIWFLACLMPTPVWMTLWYTTQRMLHYRHWILWSLMHFSVDTTS